MRTDNIKSGSLINNHANFKSPIAFFADHTCPGPTQLHHPPSGTLPRMAPITINISVPSRLINSQSTFILPTATFILGIFAPPVMGLLEKFPAKEWEKQ